MPPHTDDDAAARVHSFFDPHGIEIIYDRYPAVGTARGAVQLLHGIGEHAGRYRELAEHLAAAGFVVYADDHRGHGRTGMTQHDGDSSRLGRLGPGGLRAAREACWTLTRLIRDENPDVPLVLIGHSWGSFLAQMLLDRHPEAYDAVVLSGSALRWPGSLNSGDLNARWSGPDANGAEWLATDQSVGRAFVSDPLTTLTPIAKLLGPIDTLRLVGRPRRDLSHDVPVLLMVGREDSVGGPRSIHRLAAAYDKRSGLTDITTQVYPHSRHEIFNDLEKAEAQADLLAWLDARIPPRA